MTIPDSDHDTLQANNREWWNNHPMSYDWQSTLHLKPGSHEFFEAIDARFFQSQAHFGHPNWPDEPPLHANSTTSPARASAYWRLVVAWVAPQRQWQPRGWM